MDFLVRNSVLGLVPTECPSMEAITSVRHSDMLSGAEPLPCESQSLLSVDLGSLVSRLILAGLVSIYSITYHFPTFPSSLASHFLRNHSHPSVSSFSSKASYPFLLFLKSHVLYLKGCC